MYGLEIICLLGHIAMQVVGICCGFYCAIKQLLPGHHLVVLIVIYQCDYQLLIGLMFGYSYVNLHLCFMIILESLL